MTDRPPSNVLPLRIADAGAELRHVFIRDLMVEADIGVHRHEKGQEQPVRINIDLTVDERGAAVADRLAASDALRAAQRAPTWSITKLS